MPGPMHPLPASAAMLWCDHLDALLEHFGELPDADVSALLDEAIDKLERRGEISAAEAAALRVVYSEAE